MSNADGVIVSPFFAFFSVHLRSSAVESQVFSPFSVSLSLTSDHGDPSLFRSLRLQLRTSFRAESKFLTEINAVVGRFFVSDISAIVQKMIDV